MEKSDVRFCRRCWLGGGFAAALAQGLEQDYSRGYRDVEGLYRADRWRRDEEVAALTRILSKASFSIQVSFHRK